VSYRLLFSPPSPLPRPRARDNRHVTARYRERYVHCARVIVVLVLFVATKAVECPDTISFSGVFRMAFNGDGPHSKRQRLEESGHRVSTRLLHDRGPRVVPRFPPPPANSVRLALRSLVPRRSVGGHSSSPPRHSREFSRGGGASPFIGVMIALGEQRRRVSRRAHRVPGVQCASGAPFTRDFPDLTSHRTRARWWRVRATRRDATRRDAVQTVERRFDAIAVSPRRDRRRSIVVPPSATSSSAYVRMSGRGPCCAADSSFCRFSRIS